MIIMYDHFLGDQRSAGLQRVNFLGMLYPHSEVTLMPIGDWKAW